MNRGFGSKRESVISISPVIGRSKENSARVAKCLERPRESQPPKQKVRSARRKMGIDITWVTDRIAVGGAIWNADNMGEIARNGITHIIDMQIEFDDTALARPHGISVCWNPIDDDFEPKPPEVFERGVGFALRALDTDGAKLLVHCAAGVHRAPMMTLALLCVSGWEIEDGMDLIEGRRPVADFADVYVRSVEEFLRGRNGGSGL
jgi:protein-tyrosine phosphatase